MTDPNVVALAGGVGGAKLADGLAQVLQPDHLAIIVNTADDFTHLGLRISPDLDTVCYTLAGVANPETGWGRINETWNVFESLKKMGMPDWFQLGDTDLATHLVRSIRLSEGRKLSQITQDFCELWGVNIKVFPMSDEDIQTRVYANEGDMEFQEYFVHRRCEPIVHGFSFEGAEKAKPAPGVLDAINQGDVIIICPSNPWVSIDPILSVPGIKAALENHLVIAVSPIIGNKTVKGPAAKMFTEMGIKPSALSVATHYGNIIDCLVLDNSDVALERELNELGFHTLITDILMHDRSDRGRLAKEIISNIIEYVRR
jgi:LPPG:FO 2-phospho-L-lactate transferase